MSEKELNLREKVLKICSYFHCEPETVLLNLCCEKIDLSSLTTIYDVRATLEMLSIECALKKALQDRWDTLSLKAVESASTIDELKSAYANAPQYSSSRCLAIKKMAELVEAEHQKQ